MDIPNTAGVPPFYLVYLLNIHDGLLVYLLKNVIRELVDEVPQRLSSLKALAVFHKEPDFIVQKFDVQDLLQQNPHGRLALGGRQKDGFFREDISGQGSAIICLLFGNGVLVLVSGSVVRMDFDDFSQYGF